MNLDTCFWDGGSTWQLHGAWVDKNKPTCTIFFPPKNFQIIEYNACQVHGRNITLRLNYHSYPLK